MGILECSSLLACKIGSAGCDFATCMCRNRGAAESNSFLAQLEAKYASCTTAKQNGKGKSRRGSAAQQGQAALADINDADFQAARYASLEFCMQTASQSFSILELWLATIICLKWLYCSREFKL